MAEQRLAFRSAILPLYAITLLVTIVVSAGRILFRHGLAVDWAAVGVRFLWVAVGVFVFIVAAVVLFRVYVSAEGLRCYTFMGNYHTLGWPEIDTVRTINLLGLRYLRVGSSQSGHTVWVPLFLADMPRFRAAVREFAGEGHILVRALA
jgi:apolipoprotein N-acyltransferase